MALREETGRSFARIALGHVARAYPYKDDHVFGSDDDVRPPSEAHPVFFGSYDWHSCVHGWWTLLTLRRMFPEMPEAAEIDALAEVTFTEEKLAVELAYLDRPLSRGFERPYGWGWLLYLQLEASRHDDRAWGARIEPLAAACSMRFDRYLRLLTYPITVGTHFNTAFALVLAREWGVSRANSLVGQIDEWAFTAFASRSDYRGWEPGGDEFLSPVLTAALLMTHAMSPELCRPWFENLVLTNGWIERECYPVRVSDRSDGKIAHLDGLNLSRAWCLLRISAALGDHRESARLQRIAKDHLEASLPHVSGDYMGEHWLASFALLAMLAEPESIDPNFT
jgi:hypothetical protein